ncbi:unnamed protein product [Leuciscus chuanchicus]
MSTDDGLSCTGSILKAGKECIQLVRERRVNKRGSNPPSQVSSGFPVSFLVIRSQSSIPGVQKSVYGSVKPGLLDEIRIGGLALYRRLRERARTSLCIVSVSRPKRETVAALVHAAPRDNVCIPPIKGLSNIVNRIGASESTNATEKTSLRGIEAKPKNRLKHVVVDDNAVPDINDVQSWSDGLIESLDDCVFTPEPETQRRVPSSESVVAVEESDHEQLPSNQEAFRRESQPKIDIQHIFGLIQEAVNTTLNNIEVRLNKTLNERLNGFERRFDAYEKKHDVCECSTKAVLQQQGIWIKQVLAVQRLHRGDNQKEAKGQSLMVDLLKQVVFMLKKNHR